MFPFPIADHKRTPWLHFKREPSKPSGELSLGVRYMRHVVLWAEHHMQFALRELPCSPSSLDFRHDALSAALC